MEADKNVWCHNNACRIMLTSCEIVVAGANSELCFGH